MVRELNMDTQRQNFWKETINKEETVRLLWHMKFSKEFARDHNLKEKDRKKQTEITWSKTAPMSTLNLQRYPKKKATAKLTDTEMGSKSPGQTGLASDMRAVTPSTRELLFKGFSALGEGRYQYLQKRKQKDPEEKYEFPVTSGWEYGWKITSSMKKSNSRPAEFGRTRIVKDSFYRRNGVLQM